MSTIPAYVAEVYKLQREYFRIQEQIRRTCDHIETQAKPQAIKIIEEELPDTKTEIFIDVDAGCLSLQWMPRVFVCHLDYKELDQDGNWVRQDYTADDGVYQKVTPPATPAQLDRIRTRFKEEIGMVMHISTVTVTRFSEPRDYDTP